MEQHINRAIQLASTGRTDEAVQLLRTILSRDPDQIMAWKWLAYLSADPQEALTAAYHVLRLAPSDDWARQSLAGLQAAAQKAATARQAAPRSAPAARPPIRVVPSALLLCTLLICAGIAGILGLNRLIRPAASVPAVTPAPPVASPTGPPVLSPAVLPTVAVDQQAPLELAPEAQVVVNTTVTAYSFEAGTVEEIQQALYTQGPQPDNGSEPSIAMTSYLLSAEWRAVATDQSCVLTAPIVRLEITYTYPQWIPTGHPDLSLYDEWDRFLHHVIAHEEHHGAIAQECAHELAGQLSTVGPASTCEQLQAAVDALVDQTYAACEQRQAAFDAVEGSIPFPLPR